MSAVREYDAAAVFITVGGASISGFAEESKVLIARNVDAFTLKVGTDGEGARSKSNNRSGRMTITLMGTSPSNAVLSALALADELTPGGAVVPWGCKDLNGGSIHTAQAGWVVKKSDAEYNAEVGERVWILETHDLKHTVAGNNESAQNTTV